MIKAHKKIKIWTNKSRHWPAKCWNKVANPRSSSIAQENRLGLFKSVVRSSAKLQNARHSIGKNPSSKTLAQESARYRWCRWDLLSQHSKERISFQCCRIIQIINCWLGLQAHLLIKQSVDDRLQLRRSAWFPKIQRFYHNKTFLGKNFILAKQSQHAQWPSSADQRTFGGAARDPDSANDLADKQLVRVGRWISQQAGRPSAWLSMANYRKGGSFLR